MALPSRSSNNSLAEAKRAAVIVRASSMAAIVVALGTITSKGRPFSATTCPRKRRIAVLRSRPQCCKIFSARTFTAGSMRERTTAVLLITSMSIFSESLHISISIVVACSYIDATHYIGEIENRQQREHRVKAREKTAEFSEVVQSGLPRGLSAENRMFRAVLM